MISGEVEIALVPSRGNVPFRLLTNGVPERVILRFVFMGPRTFDISEEWVFNRVCASSMKTTSGPGS